MVGEGACGGMQHLIECGIEGFRSRTAYMSNILRCALFGPPTIAY